MTTIVIDEDLKLSKNHFKNINEFNLTINFVGKKRKLSPKKLLEKYNLQNINNIGKKTDITNEIDSIAYNI